MKKNTNTDTTATPATTTTKTRKARTPRTLTPEEIEAKEAITAAKQKLADAKSFAKLKTTIDKLSKSVRQLLIDYLETPAAIPAQEVTHDESAALS